MMVLSCGTSELGQFATLLLAVYPLFSVVQVQSHFLRR